MFKSNARFSNFAQAGKSAADDVVRSFAASRRNAPKYDEMAQKAVQMRSKEKIAVMKAEQEVAMAGIRAKADVKTNQIETDAKANLAGAKRKAGALAAAGQLFGNAGQFLGEKRKKREVGTEDAWYDERIRINEEAAAEARETAATYSTPDSDTPESNDTDNSGGTATASTSNTTSKLKPISSYQASGTKGKYSVSDMTQFALGAGFTPEQARVMGAIGMAESGGNATIDTVQSGLDPSRSNEFSVGLFQVNAQAHGDKLRKLGYTADDLRDPAKAAQVAKMVYDEVGSFKPWSVYKSGAYSQYLQ